VARRAAATNGAALADEDLPWLREPSVVAPTATPEWLRDEAPAVPPVPPSAEDLGRFATSAAKARRVLADQDPGGEAEAIAPPVGSPAWWDAQPPADEVRTARAEQLRRDAGGIDAADLLELELAPLRELVPGLLYEGTTIIAAEPKIGKSTLTYQACVEVAVGGELLGRRVASGSALYLALEDGSRRGQQRLRSALGGRTLPRGRLEVRWSAPKIGKGLEDSIGAWLDAHADAAIVAIDTLGKVRPQGDARRNAYQVDVEDLARLQDLFRDRPVALVIVHHARKQAHDDFLASVSGTYGISGSADTVIVVRRKRHEEFGTLDVTGRDVAEAEIPVRFADALWHAAPAALPEASFERMQVYRVIDAQGPIFAKAIADATGLERTSVQHLVTKLADSGAVVRTTKGYVARARTTHTDNSGHSGSDGSGEGHTRASARGASVGDRMASILQAQEPEDVDEPEDMGPVVAELFPDIYADRLPA
jgi:hypothetical protein